MKRKTGRTTAFLLIVVWILGNVTACAPKEAEKIDLEAQRAEFARVAQSRFVEEAVGLTPQTTLETEGDLLVFASYPSVEANAAVSSELQGYADKEVSDFRAEAQGMGRPDDTTGLFTLTLTYKPYPVGAELLGVKFTESAYTGRTDRENYVDSFVYHLGTGQRMGLADVFDSNRPDYLNAVSDTVRQYLLENEIVRKNMREDLFQTGTSPNTQNYSNFVLTPDNQILFFFNKNTVAPGEAGTLEVCVPLLEFDGILNPENREILFGRGAAQQSGGAAASIDLSAYPQFNMEGNYLPVMPLDGIDPLNGKVVALTFDDGPGPYTDQLLDILRDNGVAATFFLVGDRVAERADTVRRMYDEGHEIATHSWDHSYATTMTAEEMANNQYGKANDAIEAAIGKRTIIDRPPGGHMTEDLAAQIGREQIMWSVDPEDWKPEYRNADVVYDNVINGTNSGIPVRDGSVVLSHDIQQTTVQAYDRIIKELKNQGYTFVTVTQMLQIAIARGAEVSYLWGSGGAPAAPG